MNVKNKKSKKLEAESMFIAPQQTLGDLLKPNCEFTSDLVLMAHRTKFVKKVNEASNTRFSQSLSQLRPR